MIETSLLGAKRVLAHPLGQELKGVTFIAPKVVFLDARLLEQRLEVTSLPLHARVSSPPKVLTPDEALREGVHSSDRRQSSTVLVSHVILCIFEAVNVDYSVLHLEGVKEAENGPAELTIFEAPDNNLALLVGRMHKRERLLAHFGQRDCGGGLARGGGSNLLLFLRHISRNVSEERCRKVPFTRVGNNNNNRGSLGSCLCKLESRGKSPPT
mmetsp:Transcript_18654/g.36293  ORF Transcript_18654/g.36293 Transcript_18654/m.36293 type:complete len:212 (+) Transcript_18654:239-874(+)